jgi:hypothetical protein
LVEGFSSCSDFSAEKKFREKRNLKGLSHEIDFKNVDKNLKNWALTRAAAGV